MKTVYEDIVSAVDDLEKRIKRDRDHFLIEQLEPDQLHQIRMKSARNLMNSNDWFFWLWNNTKNQPWLEDLLYNYWSCPTGRKVFPSHFIDADRFADALYNYLNGVFPSFYLQWKALYEKSLDKDE